MRNLFMYFFAAAAILAVTSCSHDDNEPILDDNQTEQIPDDNQDGDNSDGDESLTIPEDMAVAFPNKVFRSFILTNFDTDGNGVLTTEEALAVTEIDVSNETLSTTKANDETAISLEGLQYFPNLIALKCQGNQLTSLDVSKNTKLEYLDCSENQMTNLDVSQNAKLAYLYCYENQLTSLEVSQNTALTTLFCSDNQLTSLDISQNTALLYLYCTRNQLTSLDVSQNVELARLECDENRLTSLDVSQNTALTYLSCWENQLTSLDVSQNTALLYLYCGGNQLASLDLSQNTALIFLECGDNQLTSLDVSNTNLGNSTVINPLYCYMPMLKTLTLKTGREINGINVNRSTMCIADNTTIKYVD